MASPSGNLWVLDPAAPAMAAVMTNGPKLMEIDLKTNGATRTIAFDEAVAPQDSYLNDVGFSPDGKTAHLTDSGASGALVVVDLASGKARPLLDGKPPPRTDGRSVDFAADCITLSIYGGTPYWQSTTGKTLYSLPTSALTSRLTSSLGPEAFSNMSLAGKIAVIGENGPANGLITSRKDGRCR